MNTQLILKVWLDIVRAPHKGVSAVEYASRYINKLIELREKLKSRTPKESIFEPTSFYPFYRWCVWWYCS